MTRTRVLMQMSAICHENTKTRKEGTERLFRAFVLSWRWGFVRSALVLVLVLVLGPRAEATVLVPADLGELVREAGAIVRGRVTETASRWSDDRRAIETVVTIEADESWKGSLGTSVRFLVSGGTLGRYRSILVGAPAFSAGQHVIVFLGWRGPSYPYLLGLNQGVFRVEADRDRGWIVTPAPIAPPASGAVRIVRGDPARRPMPLAEFEERVRDLAGAQR